MIVAILLILATICFALAALRVAGPLEFMNAGFAFIAASLAYQAL
jgi:hypothetical protein